ncbi:MAG: DUF4298 domain-containing protein [Weeksellaceae bacterium]
MNSEEINKREEELKELEQEMLLLEQDVDLLKQMHAKLKEIHERKQKLEHYYFQEGYRADRKIEHQFKDTYGLLSEDGLWNLFYEIDQEQLQLLKFLVNNLR